MSGIMDVELKTAPVKRGRGKSAKKVVEEKVVEPVIVKETETVKEEKPKKVTKPRKLKGQPIVLSSDDSDETATPASTVTAKKSNNWLDHVKKYREDNPTVSYKDCLKLAKENYAGNKK